MASEAADWRQRYDALLARHEAAEARWEALRDALVRLASRLALAAHGIDPRLDEALESVRARLRGELDAEALERETAALAALLRELAEPVAGAGGGGTAPCEEPSSPPEPAPGPAAAQPPRRGLLARLFGRGGGGPESGDGALQALRAGVERLVEALPADAGLSSRAESLRAEVREAADAGALARVLAAAAELLGEAGRRLERERAELEGFLAQLDDRLQELDGFVRSQDEAREASREDGRALDEAVRGHVEGIEDSLREAHDLASLRRAVGERLEHVREHLARFREREEARYRQAREEAERLRGRIDALEREAAGLRERLREEREQALTDPLTGLPNRLAYEERIAQEHARWKRFATPLSLVVVDVDHFKAINDRYGHRAGDKVLRALGRLLRGRLRETDLAARYGGEEFVLVLPGADREAAAAVADEIRRAVAGYGFHYQGEPVRVTVSCGVASFGEGDTPERVFERADAALYAAKAAGRDCVRAG